MFSNFFFFENLSVYEVTWKNTVEPGRPHMTVWRMLIGMLDPKGYRYTLRIRNTYCLSITAKVARTRLNVTS